MLAGLRWSRENSEEEDKESGTISLERVGRLQNCLIRASKVQMLSPMVASAREMDMTECITRELVRDNKHLTKPRRLRGRASRFEARARETLRSKHLAITHDGRPNQVASDQDNC